MFKRRKLEQQLADTLKDVTANEADVVALSYEALAIAKGAVALSGCLGEVLKKQPDSQILSAEELQALAEVVPQWSIRSGVANGNAYKAYSRTIAFSELPYERKGNGKLARDTYLSLADGEFSDLGLAQIFDTYNFSGSLDYEDGYHITVYAPDAGPITYDDFARVLDAEEYLHTAGYIEAPEPETTYLS